LRFPLQIFFLWVKKISNQKISSTDISTKGVGGGGRGTMAVFIQEGTIHRKNKRANTSKNTTATNHRHLLWIAEAGPRAIHQDAALGDLNITSAQNISNGIKRESCSGQ